MKEGQVGPSGERGLQSGRPDLNRGPHRPERCALPGCATPRGAAIISEVRPEAGCAPLLGGDRRFLGDVIRRATLLLIGLLALASSAVPSAGAAEAPPGFAGIAPQSSLTEKDFALMQIAGVTSVRLP